MKTITLSFRSALKFAAVVTIAGLSWSTQAHARDGDAESLRKLKELEQIMVLDGTGLHIVGNLQLYVCNWGAFGSYPGTTFPTGEFPSAQWPANSGVEHLYTAGLWVGAKKNGIPVVSIAGEFRPTNDPIDIIYEGYEGIPGGDRLPANADDDRDGLVDEDWLNGYDDDHDGKIDEDFSARGRQMLSCWFTDDQPHAIQLYPEHTPLHLLVRQESYQWDDVQYYDFVAVEYTIKNYGFDIIEDLYIGFYADGDIGPRGRGNYWEDDLTGLWEGVVCAKRGGREEPINISIAYFYDNDGDGGRAYGYFGVLFLGHDTDPLGKNAPRAVGITSYQNFSARLPFDQGGDPTNDYERYALMSRSGRDSKDENAEVPRDYRMLMSVGPFRQLPPDSMMTLQLAFVCGEGLDGMLENAATAALAYKGNWFDIDDDRQTGVRGRETPIYGPVDAIDPDSCDNELEAITVGKGEIIWVNLDCREELRLWYDRNCFKGDATFREFQTGVDGKERQIHWLVDSAPPAPHLRVVPGDRSVMLFWDNFSEVTPDVATLMLDFEGYRVWRADGWSRPIGTNTLSGPSRELWLLIEERDLVNGVAPDKNFKRPFGGGGWQYEPLGHLPDKDKLLKMFEESLWYAPLDTVPCPPGLTDFECDTLEALARYRLGFEGGLQYYQYIDGGVRNGMHYFYSVTAYDHLIEHSRPVRPNHYGDPMSNFTYIVPISGAQAAYSFSEREVYVVPNPATRENIAPWQLEPNQDDPTGLKIEFRNLPMCRNAVRIYTLSGDLVEVLYHDGTGGDGTLAWDLVSRNGQDIASGVYLFAVEPADGMFANKIGKFVVVR